MPSQIAAEIWSNPTGRICPTPSLEQAELEYCLKRPTLFRQTGLLAVSATEPHGAAQKLASRFGVEVGRRSAASYRM